MRERTAAVVVNYNDSETTLAQIRRIRDYAALDRIIVVDNASTDRSLAALRAVAGGKVTVLAAKRNGGYGAGNNLGIRYAAARGFTYALIANPDAEFTEDCLRGLVSALEKNPGQSIRGAAQMCSPARRPFRCGDGLRTSSRRGRSRGVSLRRSCIIRKVITAQNWRRSTACRVRCSSLT